MACYMTAPSHHLHQWWFTDPLEETGVEFESKYKSFHERKYIVNVHKMVSIMFYDPVTLC